MKSDFPPARHPAHPPQVWDSSTASTVFRFGIFALFMDEMDPGWSHGTVREDGNAIGCEIGKLRPVRQHRVGRGTRRTGSLRAWTQHTPGRGEDSRLGRSKIPGPDGEQKRCPRQNDNRSGNEQSKLLQRERSNTGEGNQAPSLGTICRLDPDRLTPGERRERA